jgi:hypothetical protein
LVGAGDVEAGQFELRDALLQAQTNAAMFPDTPK